MIPAHSTVVFIVFSAGFAGIVACKFGHHHLLHLVLNVEHVGIPVGKQGEAVAREAIGIDVWLVVGGVDHVLHHNHHFRAVWRSGLEHTRNKQQVVVVRADLAFVRKEFVGSYKALCIAAVL